MCCEVPEEGGLRCDLQAADAVPMLEHLLDRLDHIIHMALGVHPSGNGQPDPLHGDWPGPGRVWSRSGGGGGWGAGSEFQIREAPTTPPILTSPSFLALIVQPSASAN